MFADSFRKFSSYTFNDKLKHETINKIKVMIKYYNKI